MKVKLLAAAMMAAGLALSGCASHRDNAASGESRGAGEVTSDSAAPDSDSEVSTGGKLVLWLAASPAAPQEMSCREKAAKMAAACGVPLARLPSSSSAVRSLW